MIFYHFMIERGGIEHMQSVLMPGSNANMTDLQAFLHCHDSDDIPVMNCLSQQTAVVDGILGDITLLCARDIFSISAICLIHCGLPFSIG